MHVAPSVALARKCEQAGVDVIVAESQEAGGHLSVQGLSSFSLIPQVVDAVTIPVIAAGGIADARGVAAALALGAEGVQVGTRFIATHECNAHPAFKQALLEASSESTAVYCRQVHASRALLTPAVQRLIEMELEGRTPEELIQFRGRGRAFEGCIHGNLEEGLLPSGSGAGLVQRTQTVAEVVSELTQGAKNILQGLAQNLAPSTRESGTDTEW
jgi:enoyl-[acyl-carrier protein] reductase II